MLKDRLLMALASLNKVSIKFVVIVWGAIGSKLAEFVLSKKARSVPHYDFGEILWVYRVIKCLEDFRTNVLLILAGNVCEGLKFFPSHKDSNQTSDKNLVIKNGSHAPKLLECFNIQNSSTPMDD